MFEFMVVLQFWTNEKNGEFNVTVYTVIAPNMAAAKDAAWEHASETGRRVKSLDIYRLGLFGEAERNVI